MSWDRTTALVLHTPFNVQAIANKEALKCIQHTKLELGKIEQQLSLYQGNQTAASDLTLLREKIDAINCIRSSMDLLEEAFNANTKGFEKILKADIDALRNTFLELRASSDDLKGPLIKQRILLNGKPFARLFLTSFLMTLEDIAHETPELTKDPKNLSQIRKTVAFVTEFFESLKINESLEPLRSMRDCLSAIDSIAGIEETKTFI